MASPRAAGIARPDLRNAVYRQWDARGERAKNIANMVFPRLDVELAAATVQMIEREQYLKSARLNRGDGAGYSRGTFKPGSWTYRTQEQGFEMVVSRRNNAIQRTYFSAQQTAAEICLSVVHRENEIAAAAKFDAAGTFSGRTTPAGTVWSTHNSADPIANVITAAQAVEGRVGVKPNTLVVSRLAWDEMKQCDAILDRLGSSSSRDAKVARMEQVAALLDIERIMVGRAMKDSADAGKDSTLADVWDKTQAIVAYIDPNPTLEGLTLGFTAHWPGDGGEFDFLVEEYYDETVRSDFVRARRDIDLIIREADCGQIITGVLA